MHAAKVKKIKPGGVNNIKKCTKDESSRSTSHVIVFTSTFRYYYIINRSVCRLQLGRSP